MVTKWCKKGLIVAAAIFVIGALVFGKDMVSYFHSSAKSVQDAVKNSVPTEFELRRAHDLLEEIIPEMHANIRLIAQEEVEIATLKGDITENEKSLGEERQRIEKVSSMLSKSHLTSYRVGELRYTREQLKEDLGRRFDHFKEAEIVLAGKRRLLGAREKSLQAALQLLDRTRAQKALLAQKIEALGSKHRLIQAASVGSRIEIDSSKLAQTEKLINQIKKRLDVAERVLAHESHFVQPIPLDTITEEDLLTQVEEYFAPASAIQGDSASTEQERELLSRAETNR